MTTSNQDWQSFLDKATGRVYYHNQRTNETSWTVPEGFQKKQEEGQVDPGLGHDDIVTDGSAMDVKSGDKDGNDVVATSNVTSGSHVGGEGKKKKKKKKKKSKKNKAAVNSANVPVQDSSPIITEDEREENGDAAAAEASVAASVAASATDDDGKPVEEQIDNILETGRNEGSASPISPVIQVQQQQQQQQQQETAMRSPVLERLQSGLSTTSNSSSFISVGSASPTMSADWTELVDANTKKPYYYNNVTKETTWNIRDTQKGNSTNRMRSSSHLLTREQNLNRRSVSFDDSAVRLAFESRVDSFLRPLTKQNSLQSFVLPQDENGANDGGRHFGELHGRHESTDSSNDGKESVTLQKVDYIEEAAEKQQEQNHLGASRAQLLHQRLTERRRTVAYNQSQVSQMATSGASKTHQKSRTSILPVEADGSHTIVLYADKHLQRIKRTGLFKKKKVVSAQKTVSWSLKLTSPLHTITNPKHQEVALQSFELILQYMGDKKAKKMRNELAKELLEIALLYVQLRNEICCQLIKQCTKNPKEQNTLRGLQLLYLVISCFPPNMYDLQEALLYFLQENQKRYPPLSPPFEYSKHTEKTLRRMVSTGPRKTLPKSFDAEIKQQVPIFGVTIDEYMIWQEEIYGVEEMVSPTTIPMDMNDESFMLDGGQQEGQGTKIIKPKVLDILCKKLLEMDGFSMEGIFRKPGSTSEVEKLKDRFSNGDLTTSGVQDVHTVASLFKLWLRELVEPIIPDELYSHCIDVARDKELSLQVVGKLPLYNRSILIVMKHSPLEQQFVKNLILQIQ